MYQALPEGSTTSLAHGSCHCARWSAPLRALLAFSHPRCAYRRLSGMPRDGRPKWSSTSLIVSLRCRDEAWLSSAATTRATSPQRGESWDSSPPSTSKKESDEH